MFKCVSGPEEVVGSSDQASIEHISACMSQMKMMSKSHRKTKFPILTPSARLLLSLQLAVSLIFTYSQSRHCNASVL